MNVCPFATAVLTITSHSQTYCGFVSLQGIPPESRPSKNT